MVCCRSWFAANYRRFLPAAFAFRQRDFAAAEIFALAAALILRVVSKNSNHANSCGFSKIVPQQTAESLPAMERTVRGKLSKFGTDYSVFQPLMVSLGVIMQIELREGASQRRLTDQYHPVQAGTLDSTYKALRESVQIWTSRR
jgi:hypothetical protein